MGKSQRLSLNNAHFAVLSVTIEPWAIEVPLNPGSILDIMITSKYDGYPYVVYHADSIEVYLWSGCTCRVLIDDIEITSLLVPPP